MKCGVPLLNQILSRGKAPELKKHIYISVNAISKYIISHPTLYVELNFADFFLSLT